MTCSVLLFLLCKKEERQLFLSQILLYYNRLILLPQSSTPKNDGRRHRLLSQRCKQVKIFWVVMGSYLHEAAFGTDTPARPGNICGLVENERSPFLSGYENALFCSNKANAYPLSSILSSSWTVLAYFGLLFARSSRILWIHSLCAEETLFAF